MSSSTFDKAFARMKDSKANLRSQSFHKIKLTAPNPYLINYYYKPNIVAITCFMFLKGFFPDIKINKHKTQQECAACVSFKVYLVYS